MGKGGFVDENNFRNSMGVQYDKVSGVAAEVPLVGFGGVRWCLLNIQWGKRGCLSIDLKNGGFDHVFST
jgi:hypothetical protein